MTQNNPYNSIHTTETVEFFVDHLLALKGSISTLTWILWSLNHITIREILLVPLGKAEMRRMAADLPNVVPRNS